MAAVIGGVFGSHEFEAMRFERSLRHASAVLIGTKTGDRVEAAHTLDGMASSEIADTCQGLHPSRQALLRKTAFPALLAGLTAPEPRVRFHCAQSMFAFGAEAEAALPALSALVLDGDDEVVRAATMALERIGARAADALVVGMRSPKPKTRMWSTYGLAGAGPNEVARRMDLLVALLSDADPGVRQAAGATLSGAGARAKPALPAMGPLLFDVDQAVRLSTTQCVARIGPEQETVQALARVAVSDASEDVRDEALASLGKSQGSGVELAVAALLHGLHDACWRARCYSARSLGEVDSAAELVVEELRKAEADPDDRVRVAACAARARILR